MPGERKNLIRGNTILSMGGVTLYGGQFAFPKHLVPAIVVVLLAQLSDRHRAVGALLRIPG
jgi:hypothetical protein